MGFISHRYSLSVSVNRKGQIACDNSHTSVDFIIYKSIRGGQGILQTNKMTDLCPEEFTVSIRHNASRNDNKQRLGKAGRGRIGVKTSRDLLTVAKSCGYLLF